MTHLATYVGLLHRSEQTLADALRTIGQGHAAESDVFHTCTMLAGWCDEHVQRLEPIARRYGEDSDVDEPERLHHPGIDKVRGTPVGLLRDLQDLYLLASLVQTSWTVVSNAAQCLRDRELMQVAQECSTQTSRQLRWLTTRMKEAAPQALLASAPATV
jgi:hypothetical protein